MKTTLEDLLHAINVMGNDTDVYVDGYDVIAVCPPIKITPAGRKHFEQALTAEVEEGDVVDDDDKINNMAYNMLVALAGTATTTTLKHGLTAKPQLKSNLQN